MKSMTGYGRGECARNGFKVTVELSSVNRKQSDIAIYSPREMEPLEPQIRDVINRHIARGRLTGRLTLETAGDRPAGKVRLNTALAKEYTCQLKRLAKELGLPQSVSLDILSRVPNILEIQTVPLSAELYWPAVEKALTKAIHALVTMREHEGKHLAKDLSARLAAMRKATEHITRRAPLAVKRFQKQLRARISNFGIEHSAIGDQRLFQEVVLFADRSDISEEIVRLQSHFDQFEGCLKSTAPVGRMLDFLAQEINRELNTIGSKANDHLISREVIKLKADLEKIREQVQNVE